MGWAACDQGLERVDAHGVIDILDYRDTVSSLGLSNAYRVNWLIKPFNPDLLGAWK